MTYYGKYDFASLLDFIGIWFCFEICWKIWLLWLQIAIIIAIIDYKSVITFVLKHSGHQKGVQDVQSTRAWEDECKHSAFSVIKRKITSASQLPIQTNLISHSQFAKLFYAFNQNMWLSVSNKYPQVYSPTQGIHQMHLIDVKNKEWSQTSNKVETVHCLRQNARHNSAF